MPHCSATLFSACSKPSPVVRAGNKGKVSSGKVRRSFIWDDEERTITDLWLSEAQTYLSIVKNLWEKNNILNLYFSFLLLIPNFLKALNGMPWTWLAGFVSMHPVTGGVLSWIPHCTSEGVSRIKWLSPLVWT